MAVSDIRAFARRLAATNSTVWPDADFLIDLNYNYGLRMLDILKLQVDRNASQTEATTNLVSSSGLVAGNVGYNGEYPFPSDYMKPVRMEVSYDGVKFVPVTIYDVTDGNTSEFVQNDINSAFSQTNPYVRFDRDSFFLRPIPTASVAAAIPLMVVIGYLLSV